MTLPTRPIEDVVADLLTGADDLMPYCIGEKQAPAIDVALPAYLREAADLLLSQAREVAEGRAVLALHQQALDEGAAVNLALQQRLEAVEGASSEIAKGEAPPQPHGHYLAHRDAVARAVIRVFEADNALIFGPKAGESLTEQPDDADCWAPFAGMCVDGHVNGDALVDAVLAAAGR